MTAINFNVNWVDKLPSTNSHLHEQIQQGFTPQSGYILATHEQTQGRGRQDRKWVATPRQNLCFSLFIKTEASLMNIPSLTMAVSLAVDEYLKALQINSAPKWPNDVMVDGKKICGILSERIELPNNQGAGIIIGIGLNVNMSQAEAAQIGRPATSIRIEKNFQVEPSTVLNELCPTLEYWIHRWENGGFKNIASEWAEKTGPTGKELVVHDGLIVKEGFLAGYGPHGELLLTINNQVETIWSGDVVEPTK